ncbi:hypothetical protein CC80DRAFT_498886 [Byssothecium circinans]|uniref:Uncharacterized protein n=1 Tax=Byssothecium circinans TaxID=147558 RepID=A0A6A5UG56_9PLEO|nr:hypothetical protein CC80DRAFT_498886 [Byssothecium circinans]
MSAVQCPPQAKCTLLPPAQGCPSERDGRTAARAGIPSLAIQYRTHARRKLPHSRCTVSEQNRTEPNARSSSSAQPSALDCWTDGQASALNAQRRRRCYVETRPCASATAMATGRDRPASANQRREAHPSTHIAARRLRSSRGGKAARWTWGAVRADRPAALVGVSDVLAALARTGKATKVTPRCSRLPSPPATAHNTTTSSSTQSNLQIRVSLAMTRRTRPDAADDPGLTLWPCPPRYPCRGQAPLSRESGPHSVDNGTEGQLIEGLDRGHHMTAPSPACEP